MKGWNRLGVILVGVIVGLSSTSARQQKKTDDEAAVRDAVKLVRVWALADRFAAACRLSPDVTADLHMALDEVLTNIIKYGYADERVHEISIKLMVEDGVLVAEIEDDGVSFDPLTLPQPDVSSPLRERQVGGVGIHFVRKLMHEVSYHRVANHNRLVFKKHLQG